MKKRRHKKPGRAGQKRISAKIRKLRHEGYEADQAAAIAYSMESKHKIGKRGGKRRKKSRRKGNPILSLVAKNPLVRIVTNPLKGLSTTEKFLFGLGAGFIAYMVYQWYFTPTTVVVPASQPVTSSLAPIGPSSQINLSNLA